MAAAAFSEVKQSDYRDVVTYLTTLATTDWTTVDMTFKPLRNGRRIHLDKSSSSLESLLHFLGTCFDSAAYFLEAFLDCDSRFWEAFLDRVSSFFRIRI